MKDKELSTLREEIKKIKSESELVDVRHQQPVPKVSPTPGVGYLKN